MVQRDVHLDQLHWQMHHKYLDLGLSVVRKVSPSLASLRARYLLIEPRTSQAVFIIPDHVAHTDPLVDRFEKWARENIEQGFPYLMPHALLVQVKEP